MQLYKSWRNHVRFRCCGNMIPGTAVPISSAQCNTNLKARQKAGGLSLLETISGACGQDPSPRLALNAYPWYIKSIVGIPDGNAVCGLSNLSVSKQKKKKRILVYHTCGGRRVISLRGASRRGKKLLNSSCDQDGRHAPPQRGGRTSACHM